MLTKSTTCRFQILTCTIPAAKHRYVLIYRGLYAHVCCPASGRPVPLKNHVSCPISWVKLVPKYITNSGSDKTIKKNYDLFELWLLFPQTDWEPSWVHYDGLDYHGMQNGDARGHKKSAHHDTYFIPFLSLWAHKQSGAFIERTLFTVLCTKFSLKLQSPK